MATKTAVKASATKSKPDSPQVHLIFGSDDFLAQTRTKQVLDPLVDKSAGDFGLETIEGRADNASQAVAALKRVNEALNTLAFFGGGKVVWLKNANFLGGSRAAESKDVAAQMESLCELLKRGFSPGYHLVISATEMDKRRSFYKTIEKVGEIISVGGPDQWGKIDMEQLESFAADKARSLGKQIENEALQSLVALTGGNYRAIASEIEKLATYIGDRKTIEQADVNAVGSASAESLPWDLLDAIGERKLSKALEVLDRLLFQGEKDVGLLFAMVSRVRMLLLLRELIDRNVLSKGNDYGWYKFNLQRVAQQIGDDLPSDKKLNPLLQHPFVVFKSVQQAQRFTLAELRRAMELLLDANKRLVSSSIDGRIVLEQTIVALVQTSS